MQSADLEEVQVHPTPLQDTTTKGNRRTTSVERPTHSDDINGIIQAPSSSSSSHPTKSAAQKALSKSIIVKHVVEHLYEQLFVLGRESRQAQLRNLSCVSKAWTEPVSERLWK